MHFKNIYSLFHHFVIMIKCLLHFGELNERNKMTYMKPVNQPTNQPTNQAINRYASKWISSIKSFPSLQLNIARKYELYVTVHKRNSVVEGCGSRDFLVQGAYLRYSLHKPT